MRFLLFFIPFYIHALEFSSFVDKTELGLNEAFHLNLQFQSDKSLPDEISAGAVFNLKDFYFLRESLSQQSSISIINGQRTHIKSVVKSYRLQPKALGVFKIPAVKVTADGQTFQTDPFEIKVLADKKPGPAPKNPFSFPGFAAPFSFPGSLFDFPAPFKGVKGDFKLNLELSKNKVYKSELVRADWFLLYTAKMPRYELPLSLPYQGFWKEEINSRKALTGTEGIGDTLYRKTSIKSLWLFPLKTGKLKIEPYSIQLFSGFSLQNQILSAKTKAIQVRELPLEGKDSNFTGAVGDFKVDFILQKKELILNQPFSFKIRFNGSGHPRFIHLPSLSFPSYLQVYDPVQKSNFTDAGIAGKEFEILLVPKKEGFFTFPSFTLSSFDPQKEKYVLHKSPEVYLSVKKDSNIAPDTAPDSKSQIFFKAVEKEKDMSSQELSRLNWPSFINYENLKSFYILYFIFCFLILLFLVIKKAFFSKKEKSVDTQANNKIRKIGRLLNKKDWQAACIEMIQLNSLILSSVQVKESSASHWRQMLRDMPFSLSKKHAKEFENLFTALERLSFSYQDQSEEQVLSQAEDLFEKTKYLTQKILSNHFK